MQAIKLKVRKLFFPLAKIFSGVNPDLLTFTGFIITCVAGFYYSRGAFFIAGIFLLIGGIFDMIDGEVARITNKVSKAGAFFDSCIDRCSDFVVFFGMFLWYIKYAMAKTGDFSYKLLSYTEIFRIGTWQFYYTAVIFCVLAIGSSFLVPYARARAESLGQECKGGLADRGVRVPVIIIGSFFGPKVFVYFLWLIVIMTIGTGIYRVIWAKGRLKIK